MELSKMIGELRQELKRIDEAIGALERLSTGDNIKRRGRPPKWLKDLQGDIEAGTENHENQRAPAAESPRAKAKTA